jgi:hypothetical protein
MSAERPAFIFSGTIFSVARQPAAICRQSLMVSTVSKRPSHASWKSLLYVVGVPFITAMKPVRVPSKRPDLPRRSSSASGFFFCGIREDPVEYASDSFTIPNCPLL